MTSSNPSSIIRRQRSHCDCGNELRPDQAFYCSHKCSSSYGHNPNALTEPKTTEEAEAFMLELEEGKKRLLSADEQLVKSQSPEDDSPEAERRLREILCPHPVYNGNNLHYVHTKVTYNRKSGSSAD